MPRPAVDPIHLALGQDALDRRADLRFADWAAVDMPRRLVLLDDSGEVALRPGVGREVALAMADAADPADPEHDILLGVDAAGTAICGRVVPRDAPEVPTGVEWAGLRSVGLRLPADQRGILAELLALANWHRTHTRCPRCGTPTAVAGLGWWRTCPQDGSDHYPRTDPAVIATLVDADDNLLLGRQARWPEGAFSTLAGFVEPGESAESAVVREIAEEVGLRPTDVRYVGSQPWPFPASLMLGFRAEIGGVRPDPTVDGVEIVEARWISREELPPLAEAREVRLPGRLSIAHHLIGQWFGGEIPDAWCRW
jgi:NAD+ diphosphatase